MEQNEKGPTFADKVANLLDLNGSQTAESSGPCVGDDAGEVPAPNLFDVLTLTAREDYRPGPCVGDDNTPSVQESIGPSVGDDAQPPF